MIKKALITLAICLSVCAFIFTCFYSGWHEEHWSVDIYRVETFHSGNGWGYRIKENGKTAIYQSHVPCIKGNKPFRDEKSAYKAGKLVLAKMKNSELPAITLDELGRIIDLDEYVGD